MAHQEFIDDARKYAVDYFAAHGIMSWGEPGLRISLRGEHFELRIFAVANPGYVDGPPILYIDLTFCGPDAVLTPDTMHRNILARVATVNPWEDGVTKALDVLLSEANVVLDENPPAWAPVDKINDKDRGLHDR